MCHILSYHKIKLLLFTSTDIPRTTLSLSTTITMIASWLPPLHLNRILGGRSCYISAQIRQRLYLTWRRKHPHCLWPFFFPSLSPSPSHTGHLLPSERIRCAAASRPLHLLPLHLRSSSLTFSRPSHRCPLSSEGCVCMLSCSVVSDSLRPHRLEPTRLLCPWDFPAGILE